MPDVETLAPSEGAAVEPEAPPTSTEPEILPAEGQPVTEIPSDSDQPEETEVDLETVPEASGDFDKFKPLYAANPELRQIIGREQALSSLAPNGSFQELKAIVERVPTLDDADSLANAAQSLRELGETYRNDPAGFTESLRENDPIAFQQWAKQLPEILASTDANLYSEQARYYSNAVLDNLFISAQRSGNQDAITSLQNVAAMLGVNLGTPRQIPTGNSEVERLRRQIADGDREKAQEKADSFWNGATEEHFNTSIAEIEGLIKKTNPSISSGRLQRMANEVWEGVNSRLASQPQTMAQLERYKADVAKGRIGVQEHKAIVDFSMRRTRQLIPLVFKEISEQWTKDVLKANQDQIDKRKGIAGKTREVAAPAGGTPGAAPARAQGSKRSFKNIWESLRNGTYQPPA